MSDARQQRIDELRAKGDAKTPLERGELRALTERRTVAGPRPPAPAKDADKSGFERGQERARERFGRKEKEAAHAPDR